MIRRALVLCIGNLCRSPMAEVLLRRALSQAGMPAEVESAGLGAPVGMPAADHAVALMRERGLDLSAHRARAVHPDLVRGADLILVMDEEQRQWLMRKDPGAAGKIFLLGHWSDVDVPDPYGLDRPAFERSLALIEQSIGEWVQRLGRAGQVAENG